MSEATAAIELCDLRKVYDEGDVTAVDGLDLCVERGEIFGLLGPNGAGKTSTVEICEGLLEPTSGEVKVLGLGWGRDARALRERIGVTLQDTRFFDKQSVVELVRLFASFYAAPRPIDEIIGLVELQSKANARYASLSGGQKQRLAVACALTGRPDLLFLDEPTTGLDPQARRQLWDVVQQFRKDGGTVLLTTHYMEEAAVLCDRIMIVDHGQSIALGTPSELIDSLGAAHVVEVHAPGMAEVEVGAFASLANVCDATIDGDALTLTVDEVHKALPAVLNRLRDAELELADLTMRTTTLDDVFVHLTGRNLRDGDGDGDGDGGAA